MIVPMSTLGEEIGKINPPVISDDNLSSRYLAFPLQTWILELYHWHSIEPSIRTTFDGQQPVSFQVDTIGLPLATQRWKLNLPQHPEITFDDLRAGKWPRPTKEELEARGKALDLATSVHDKLDIRPLTAATIVRQLREGKEERD